MAQKKSRRRGRGEGSIHKVPGRGWVAVYHVPDSGRRQRKTRYAKTQAEARKKLTQLLHQFDSGRYDPSKPPRLADYLSSWLETHDVGPRTRISYEEILRLHLIPEIGRIRIDQLRVDHVDALMSRKLGSGLSPRRVDMIRAVLRIALNKAIVAELIPRNVAALAKPPRQRRKEMTIWSIEQVKTFFEAANATGKGVLFETAVHTGLRLGEVTGIKWVDVDLEKREIDVKRNLQRLTGHGLVELSLKSESSRKLLHLSKSFAERLRTHRADQLQARLLAGSEWHDTGYVFTTRIGTPLDGRNISRTMRSLIEQLDLPRIRFHDLRHTSATISSAVGNSIPSTSRRLGHASAYTTLHYYGHATEEEDRQAAERISEALYGDDELDEQVPG